MQPPNPASEAGQGTDIHRRPGNKAVLLGPLQEGVRRNNTQDGKMKAEGIKIKVIGVQTGKEANRYTKCMEDLLKALSGDKNLKLKVAITRIYCATCNTEFKTFVQLRKHIKATGHTDT
jgi:hypothetical protein